MQKLYVSS